MTNQQGLLRVAAQVCSPATTATVAVGAAGTEALTSTAAVTAWACLGRGAGAVQCVEKERLRGERGLASN